MLVTLHWTISNNHLTTQYVWNNFFFISNPYFHFVLQDCIFHFSVAKTDQPTEGLTSNKIVTIVPRSFISCEEIAESSKLCFEHLDVTEYDDMDDADDDAAGGDDNSLTSAILKISSVHCKIGHRLFNFAFDLPTGVREFKEIFSNRPAEEPLVKKRSSGEENNK